jgi:dienelactone hydrolase
VYQPAGLGSESDVLQHASPGLQISGIYLYDLQNGLTRCLTCETPKAAISDAALIKYQSPLFSPTTHSGNSHWIAWIAESLTGRHAGQRDLILENLKDRIQYNLTRHWAGRVNRFWWSNDGRSLLFTATHPDSIGTELYRVEVLDDDHLHTPLVIQQITHLHTAVAALVGETPTAWLLAVAQWHHLQKVFLVDKQNGNTDLLVQADTSLPSLHPFITRDFLLAGGVNTRVQVYRSAGFDAARKYPAIICLPDLEWFGPYRTSADPSVQMVWDQPQMLADAGYQVFTISPEFGMSNAKMNDDENNPRRLPDALAPYLNPATMQSLADSLCQLLVALSVDTQHIVLMGSGWGAYLALRWGSDRHFSCRLPVQSLVLWNPVVDIPAWEATTSARWIARQINDVLERDKLQPALAAAWQIPSLPMLIGVGGHDGLVSSHQGLGLFNEVSDRDLHARLLYFPDITHYWKMGHDLLVWQHQVLNWLQNP